MIRWDEITWYSKFLTLVVFFIFTPILFFSLGIQYKATVDEPEVIYITAAHHVAQAQSISQDASTTQIAPDANE